MINFTMADGVTILSATQSETGYWNWSSGSWGPGNSDQFATQVALMCPDGYIKPTTPITTPIPASITNAQCRAMLLNTPNPSGTPATLYDVVNSALTTQGGIAYQFWEYANDFDRNGALVQSMSASLGLTSAQVDQMFIAASSITV